MLYTVNSISWWFVNIPLFGAAGLAVPFMLHLQLVSRYLS